MTFKRKSVFGIEYEEPTSKDIKRIFLFGALLVAVLIASNIFYRSNDSRAILKYEDEVYMRVNKIRKYKGSLILNDSLFISSHIKAIKKPEYLNSDVLIEYLGKPYLLKKEKSTREFYVIDNQYTYTFILFEDNGL